MSDEDGPDSYFRIPRGSSDEEIDSDLVSIPDQNDVPASPNVAKPHSSRPTRRQINDAASALTTGRNFQTELDVDPVLDSDHDSDGGDPANSAATLAKITSTVVRKARGKDSRKVEPVSHASAKTFGATQENDSSHPEMMSRIMEALGNANSTAATQEAKMSNLAKVAKSIAKVHEKEAELNVPEERIVTDKIERQTTYRLANEDLSKNWELTVERNRQVDKLSFPLVSQVSANKSTGELAATKKKQNANDYEGEIQDILREAGVISKSNASQKEEDGDNDKISRKVESQKEIQMKRRELAKMRSDVFRYAQKMKRIKKIKSKEYRKVLRKEKRKLDELDANFNDALADAVKAEQKRVEERVTLRHKNTSKWIKRKLQRGEGKQSADTREAIEEQLRLHERLKLKQGFDPSALGHDPDESDREDDEELELSAIEAELLHDNSDGQRKAKKGLMSLKFMQAAEARERQQAQAMLEEKHTPSDEEDVGEQKVVGRMAFTGKASEKGDALPESNCAGSKHKEVNTDLTQLAYEEDSVNGVISSRALDSEKLSGAVKTSDGSKNGFTTILQGKLGADDTNPWLQVLDASENNEPSSKTNPDGGKLMPQGNGEEGSNVRNGSTRVASSPKARSAQPNSETIRKKGKKRKKGAKDDKQVDPTFSTPTSVLPKQTAGIAPAAAERSQKPQTQANKRLKPTKEKEVAANTNESSEQDHEVKRMENVAALFSGAGGADLADFQEAKEAEIEAELPTAKSLQAEVLPGWGQWDGAGVRKKAKHKKESAFARAARERLEESRNNAIQGRTDRKLQNVVLEQRRSQKAAQLTLGSVPFPFVSRDQWQRELSNPVSAELLSSSAFKNNVEKKVSVKVGSVIEPMSAETRWNPGRAVGGKQDHGKRALLARRKDRVESRDSARRGLLS